MYRDWYVASINQMTAEDTARFLSLLEVLKRPQGDISLLRLALREAEMHLEHNLQVYILPYLVEIAISRSELQKEAKNIIGKIARNSQSMVPKSVIENIEKPDGLRAQMQRLGDTNSDSFSFTGEDYITLTESVDSIICLSALINYDENVIQGIAQDEACTEFLLLALKGVFGRYAMVLSQEASLLSGSSSLQDTAKANLKKTGRFCEFPDTIEIYLKYHFNRSSVEEILKSIFAKKSLFNELVRQQKIKTGKDNTEFWLFSGLPSVRKENQYKRQLNILWENIAIYLVIQKAMQQQKLSGVIECISKFWMKRRDKEGDAICPWIPRVEETDTKAKKIFIRYNGLENQDTVLKAALATPILSAVFLDNLGQLPEFLYELVMNLSDVYSKPEITNSVNKGYHLDKNHIKQTYFSDAMISLLVYAQKTIAYIGKGYLDGSVPEQLFLLMEKYTKCVLNGTDEGMPQQRKYLHNGVSVRVCASFAYEEGSAEFLGTRQTQYWMKGGSDSFAARTCEIALNDLWNYTNNLKNQGVRLEQYIIKPVNLAYEHFPEIIESANIKSIECQENNKIPDPYIMLLHLDNPDSWIEQEIKLDNYPREEHSYRRALTAVAVQVYAILGKAGRITTEERRVIYAWIKALLSMNSAKHFPRVLRFLAFKILERFFRRTIQLDLDPEDASQREKGSNSENDGEEKWDATDMIQIMVETIADLSREAPFYQYAVANVIINAELEENFQQTREIIECALFHILLSQNKEQDIKSTVLTDPYLIAERGSSREIRQQIILWYIGNIVDHLSNRYSDMRQKFVQMLEKWYQRNGYQKEIVVVKKESIELKQENGVCVVLCDKKTASEKWYEWDPDVLGVWKSKKEEWTQEVFIRIEDEKHVLLEREFPELVLERGFKEQKSFRLVLQSESDAGYLFSAGTGCNYRILPEFIEENSLVRLQQKIDEYKESAEGEEYPRGLYLDVEVDTDTPEKVPFLRVIDFCEENLNYMGLFSDNEYLMAEIKEGKWQVEKNNYPIEIEANNPYKDMSVEDGGWDVFGQRCGRVKLKKVDKIELTIGGKEDDIKRHIERLCAVKPEDYLKVQIKTYGGIGKYGFLDGVTKENIPVKIEADSVKLGNNEVSSREYECCVVTFAPSKIWDKPESYCDGVIWKYSPKIQEKNMPITVKYIKGDTVFEVQTDSEKLGQKLSLNTIYVGMPVFYDCDTKEVIPAFYAPKKKLLYAGKYRVRYLWKLSVETGDNIEKYRNRGLDLGIHRITDEGEAFHLIQDFKKRKVYAFCEKATLEQLEEKLYQAASRVRIVRYHNDLIDVQHLAEDIKKEEDSSSKLRNQNRHQAELRYKKYMEWIGDSFWNHNGCPHAEGIIGEKNGEQYFELKAPITHLPVDRRDISAEDADKWVMRIKVQHQKIHFADSSKLTYAKIVETEDGGFIADVDGAEIFNLIRFQKWLYKEYSGRKEYQVPLFYINEEENNLFFEWGIGKVLKVNKRKFIIKMGKKEGFIGQLFCGDKISSFGIQQKEKGKYLVVSIENYEYSIEHRIMEDAKNNILQYVVVRFDKKKDTVTAVASTVSKYRLDNEDAAWSFKRIKAAHLKEEVEQEVKKELPNGGTGCILLQVKKKSLVRQLHFGLADLDSLDRYILCLKGGEICDASQADGKERNDYYVPFNNEFESEFKNEVSDIKMIGKRPEISIKVYRRAFSYSESILRVYYGKDRTAFQKYMYVEVFKKEKRDQGSIKNLPCRLDAAVRKWLGLFGPQDVVAGQTVASASQKMMRVEIKPGVFCMARFEKELQEGAIGRLSLRGEDIFIEPVSYSDASYLADKRVVELLMMDNAFRGTKGLPQFTVAGMPQLKLDNPALAEQLKRKYPPRYGQISDGSLVGKDDVNYGYLKVENVDGTDWIQFYKKKRKEKEKYINYHAITFWDAGIVQITKHIKRGQWHYHDRVTQVRLRNYEEYVSVEYGENSELPVVFDEHWSLRFREEELDKYLFPPHEIEEYGLPEKQYDLDYEYPVAGCTDSDLFIELSPGRIVKIPVGMLYLVDSNQAVGTLCTKYISKGDTVKLSVSVSEPGKPMHIRLLSVKYGIRKFIKKRAFLPVVSSKGGCTTLGGGIWKMEYPRGNMQNGAICTLDRENNHLHDCKKEKLPQPEDMVFLELDEEKEIRAVGFDFLSIRISEKGEAQRRREDAEWIRNIFLMEDDREIFFQAMGGRVPVLVDQIVDHEMYVYYPQPSLPESGTVLCCQMLGVLVSSYIFVRSGSFLGLIDIKQELRLDNKELGAELAKHLPSKEQIWLHYYEGKFKIGCYKRKDSNKREVSVKAVIDCGSGHGFLCEDMLSHEFYWMPVENVSRAGNVLAEQVFDILFKEQKKKGRLFVEIDGNGYASYLKKNMSLIIPFENLNINDRDKKIKVVVHSEIARNRYVCYERPQGNIYLLKTEFPQERGNRLDACCIKKYDNMAVLTSCDEIRTPVHLSLQVLGAVRESWKGLEGQDKQIRRSILNNALTGYRERNRKSGDELKRFSQRLFKLMKDDGETDSSLIKCKNDIPDIIQHYFKELHDPVGEGTAVSRMNLENVLLIAAIASLSNVAVWRTFGEELCSVIRKNISYYCCEEVLLTKWLLVLDYGSADLRTLLNTNAYFGGVELKANGKDGLNTDQKDGQLTKNQTKKITDTCETILRRYRDDEADVHTELALCLLEVSGQIEKYPHYRRDLQNVIKKTRCYRKILKRKEIDQTEQAKEIANFLLELSEEDGIHNIGILEERRIYDIFARACVEEKNEI